MTAQLPPVPPAGRSPKGPGEIGKDRAADAAQDDPQGSKAFDPDQQRDPGNTKQNTTNQGLQQDR